MSEMKHAAAGYICNCGNDGWMDGVEHIPPKWTIPPMSQREMRPLAITDHIMQGYLTTMVNWMSNGESKVIVHFGIDRRGRIVQFHPVNRVGRHVSGIYSPLSKIVQREGQHSGTTGANGYTIGIEHEGCAVDPRPAYTVPADLIYSKTNPWPEPMVASSIRVKQWCFDNVPSLGLPSRDTVIGHYEIDARNRPDDPAPSTDRTIWPVERMLRFITKPIDPPKQEPPKETKKMSNAYIVQAGDTLGAIAREFDTTVAALAELNGLANPNVIQKGWVLRTRPEAPQPVLIGGGTVEKPDVRIAKAQSGVIRRALDILDADLDKVSAV